MMINPILIIVGAALILSAVSVSLINKPKKPIVTGTVLLILICFVVFTFLIDSAFRSVGTGEVNEVVYFLTMNETLTYEALAASFNTFMWMDIGLIVASLVTLFVEIMMILRKGSGK